MEMLLSALLLYDRYFVSSEGRILKAAVTRGPSTFWKKHK